MDKQSFEAKKELILKFTMSLMFTLAFFKNVFCEPLGYVGKFENMYEWRSLRSRCGNIFLVFFV